MENSDQFRPEVNSKRWLDMPDLPICDVDKSASAFTIQDAKDGDGNFYIYLSGSYEDFSEPISFCPFCGRKLK